MNYYEWFAGSTQGVLYEYKYVNQIDAEYQVRFWMKWIYSYNEENTSRMVPDAIDFQVRNWELFPEVRFGLSSRSDRNCASLQNDETHEFYQMCWDAEGNILSEKK